MSALPSLAAVARAFRERRFTPSQLAARVLATARSADGLHGPRRNPFTDIDETRVMRAAAEADARWAAGAPRGPFDGVPIGVKDHVDVEGYVTRNGASWYGAGPARVDAPVVAQLRDAGAVVVGKLHQHELGLGATGINPHFPAPRNPHHVGHCPGGSSSGSGVAVAMGLVPVAVAADGGGSIRIPASLNGVFGLKPTFGRCSRTAADLDGSTLAMAGPIASNVDDLALFLRHTCAHDPRDRSMHGAPPLDLAAIDRARRPAAREGKKLRLGVVEGEIDHADPAVARAVERALAEPSIARNVELVPVRIPSLSLCQAIGFVTFGVEAAAGHRENLAKHREKMGLDVRLVLALGERLTGADFLHAQKHRAILRRDVDAALREVDLLVLPTTACTAPRLRDAAERTGEIDDAVTAKLTRYTMMANLCGLPAASLPIGVDEKGLPIGLQLVGAGFDEATVLRGAWLFERDGVAACPIAQGRLSIL